MKLTLAIALLFTTTLSLADDKAAPAADAPAAASTPMTKENTSATAKKRLHHVGQNIEHMGDQAGKKLGVKNVHESAPATTEVPAPGATATPSK